MNKIHTIIFIFFAVVIGSAAFLLFPREESLQIKKVELSPTKDLVAYADWSVEAVAKTDSEKNQIQNTQEEKTKEPEITLLAVGDIMLSRAVEKKMIAYNDFNYPFLKVKDLVSGADIAIGNLESPIIAGDLVSDGEFYFRADPKSAKSLADAGFDVLSLANNHTGNFGQEGFLKTFEYLSKENIGYIGAGKNSAALMNVYVMEVDNIKIAFLSYGYGPTYYESGAKKAGIDLMVEKKLIADIKKAKEKADLIIVSMHDGTEYVNQPSEHQKNFARLAVDNGADLVIGHHPHVVQKMEVYKDKYIFYSLGNFVFDQMWSVSTRQGLAVEFTLDKNGIISYEPFPIVIEDYSQPRFADEKESKAILEKLN